MPRRRSIPRPRKTSRRWHIPPPLVYGPESLEGAAVLEEVNGPLGVLLWQTLRDVRLWVDSPVAERRQLFTRDAADGRAALVHGAAPTSGLDGPVTVLSSLLAGRGDEEGLAGACRSVAAWAEQEGAPATSLAFTQAAALVRPADPDAAFTVARLAARAEDAARAEVWYRRALGLARQARDWRTYARAFRGLGHLYLSRGNLPGAQRFFVRALRGARRGGLRVEQAIALHELFGVASRAGRHDDAERYAREALAAYGNRNPRLVLLAQDLARYRAAQDRPDVAAQLLNAALPLLPATERDTVRKELDRLPAGAGANAAVDAGGSASDLLARDLVQRLHGLASADPR